MLAIFQKQVAHAPQELNSPRGSTAKPRNPDEILRDFHAAHPADAFSTSFGGGAALACVAAQPRSLAAGGCGRSYAPFPPGCMFHSEGGLKSFEHPMNRLKALPRVDSEGAMCGANFKVDAFTKINSMPRVGSATNWAATWDDAAI
ncbi:unnamed protein product [Triticum turgidum subsp. durum]|uniref:DUF3700 domain-containing protein n=1 Tax=Triticum turgidum subsp. durum TaxID=4567 RepID=A0A9R1RUN2_TRITD|nr:unnamed protein product [Triticum turgidum subsp. durum]